MVSMMRERAIVHVVEPQHLFIATLIALFRDAGLPIDHVSPEPDRGALLDQPPDIVFLDTDHLDDPFAAVRLVQALAPSAQIVVFVGTDEQEIHREFLFAGATSVLAKSADRQVIVGGLRRAEYRRLALMMPRRAPASR
jgi:DNA-binding NarL/FixJ family response regulator